MALSDITIPSLTLKVADWGYLISYIAGSTEQEHIKIIRKIRNAVQSIPDVAMNTDLEIINISGTMVHFWYSNIVGITVGEKEIFGNTVYNTIKAIPDIEFQTYITATDESFDKHYQNKRKIGKNIIFDND